jgi:hypothetical protein
LLSAEVHTTVNLSHQPEETQCLGPKEMRGEGSGQNMHCTENEDVPTDSWRTALCTVPALKKSSFHFAHAVWSQER